MAGQPQEPSWQSTGQEQTRVSPAWPQPTYTPPAGAPQDGYAYAPPDFGQAPGQPGQPGQFGQPGQPGQPGQFGQPDQFGQPGQPGQPGYGQSGQGPGPDQWQALAGLTAAQSGPARQRGERGFLGSLFDFTFTSFVTPKIIRVLYILFTVWTAIWAVIILKFGFHYGAVAGIFILLVVEPIFILLTLGVYRMVLEAFMVVFRMHEELKKIRERAEGQD